MNIKQKLITTLSVLGLVVLVSCSAIQNSITPCYIDADAAAFAHEPLTEMMPWTTVQDALRINSKMDFIYHCDKLEYRYLKDNLESYIADAEQFKQIVFSPNGPLGLLLPAGMGLVAGSYLVSKPDDKKKILELENGKAKA